MRVLRRRFDNTIQFASFGGIALLISLTSRTPYALAVGAALGVLAIRTIRAGVYIDEAGITVRNIFRTHRVPWDDYTRVDIGRAGRPGLPVVLLSRQSAGPVPLWCVQPSTRSKRGADKLVGLLAQVQRAIRDVRPEAAPS